MPGLAASRYNILVPLARERTLAYNALSGAMALWEADDRAAYDRILDDAPVDPNDAPIVQLVQAGFAVGAGVDELGILQDQYQAHRFDPSTMILTIAPTLACNFGCDYCFQGQEKPKEGMSPAVQDAVLDLVEHALPNIRHLHVAWYGGEPLLKRAIIEALSDRLMARCAAAGVGYDASMVSNGFLLTAEVARDLHARRVKTVQVTLDGTPNYHDQRRSLLSGKPTFARIAGNLAAVANATPIHLSIRVNIDERNRAEIEDLLQFLANAGLGHRPNVSVYFAPVEAMTEGCHAVTDVTMAKMDYGSLEARLTKAAFELGLCGLPYPPRFRGTCAAVRPKGMVIVPNGDVHKCWDTVAQPQHAVGTVFDLEALAHSPKAREWITWTPFVNSTCRNCRILPICAGACAYKFVHADATRGEAATLPCPSWKYNIKERLLLRAEKSGALTAEDLIGVAPTDPSELCTDDWRGGAALPAEMEHLMTAARQEHPWAG